MAARIARMPSIECFRFEAARRLAIEAEEEQYPEEGKLEFRDAKSGSVSSPGQTGGVKSGMGCARGGKWGEDEGRKLGKTLWGMERREENTSSQGIFTAIFSTTYPQIPCPNL